MHSLHSLSSYNMNWNMNRATRQLRVHCMQMQVQVQHPQLRRCRHSSKPLMLRRVLLPAQLSDW